MRDAHQCISRYPLKFARYFFLPRFRELSSKAGTSSPQLVSHKAYREFQISIGLRVLLLAPFFLPSFCFIQILEFSRYLRKFIILWGFGVLGFWGFGDLDSCHVLINRD